MQKQKGNLAIASVPIQEWGELYSADEAIKTGTIFRDLDLPFFAADSIPDREPGGRVRICSAVRKNRNARRICWKSRRSVLCWMICGCTWIRIRRMRTGLAL